MVSGQQQSRKSKGFTLLELMTTLGVVAVIAAVAIPTYIAYLKRDRKVECQASVRNFLRAQELYYLDNQNFYPLRPGETTNASGEVVEIGWNPTNRPAQPLEYVLTDLAMEFRPDGHRGYKIRAVNVQQPELFEQSLVFSLRTDEGFHNDGTTDYQYQFKMFNRQDSTGPPSWNTNGQWMVRNWFWFDIFGCPAWRWTPKCQR
ncbi:MAG: prepilin-type N-terminal cleavage/methylation domain-containing protein [Syntrophobacterales bacterium]|jgi:prepilin-type N-terminal cleavage/methylation domain-containing protein